MFLLELFLDCEFIQIVYRSLGGIVTSNIVQLEKISRSKQQRLKVLHTHHVVPAYMSFGLDSFGAIGQKCLHTDSNLSEEPVISLGFYISFRGCNTFILHLK